MVYGN